MRQNLSKLTFLIVIIITSCKTAEERRSAAVEKYGYIDTVEITDANIKLFASKWGIEPNELYLLDKEGYSKTIWAINEENKRLTHDLYQWHQLFIFDKSENLLSYQLNCRTEKEDNDWNYNALETFNTYPPKDNSLKKFNRELKLSQISSHFIGQNGISLKDEREGDEDIVIVTYWTIYHGRQSKNLIQLVKDYKERNADKKIKVAFVNNDIVK